MECGGGVIGLLCSAFVPSVGVGERVGELHAMLQTRFPFSLAVALQGAFGGGVGEGGVLPTNIGFITLAWDSEGWLGFLGVVKMAVTVFMTVGFLWALVDRLTPQVTI